MLRDPPQTVQKRDFKELAKVHGVAHRPTERLGCQWLSKTFSSPFRDLLANVEKIREKSPEESRPLAVDLLYSRGFADHSRDLQRILPSFRGEDYERCFIAWRALDDMSCEMAFRVQSRISADGVATPHGIVLQPAKTRELRDHLVNLREAGKRVQVWRRVSRLHQRMAWSPYWALGEPIVDPRDNASRYGIPEENVSIDDSVVTGSLRPGTTLVVRPAAAVGKNLGGALEAVVLFDGIVMDETEERRRLMDFYLDPARSHVRGDG
jgi:hypothetical protein